MAKSSVVKKVADLFEFDDSSDSMLYDFFVDSLKDIYWAEKQIVKTLPKMQKAASSLKLQKAFERHTVQSETHVKRLEKVFDMLGETARGKKCEAIVGLIDEGKTIIGETEKNTATRDVGLIFAAQKVEHYEIATYGGIVQLARTLGQVEIADLLGKTLAEEKETDEHLTEIAESGINYQAVSE